VKTEASKAVRMLMRRSIGSAWLKTYFRKGLRKLTGGKKSVRHCVVSGLYGGARELTAPCQPVTTVSVWCPEPNGLRA